MDFRAQYLGRIIPDCNRCVNLYITEEDQNALKEVKGRCYDHFCTMYSKRVIHNNPPNLRPEYHSPFIFPCEECYRDIFENFERRTE